MRTRQCETRREHVLGTRARELDQLTTANLKKCDELLEALIAEDPEQSGMTTATVPSSPSASICSTGLAPTWSRQQRPRTAFQLLLFRQGVGRQKRPQCPRKTWLLAARRWMCAPPELWPVEDEQAQRKMPVPGGPRVRDTGDHRNPIPCADCEQLRLPRRAQQGPRRRRAILRHGQ